MSKGKFRKNSPKPKPKHCCPYVIDFTSVCVVINHKFGPSKASFKAPFVPLNTILMSLGSSPWKNSTAKVLTKFKIGNILEQVMYFLKIKEEQFCTIKGFVWHLGVLE